MKYKTTKQIKSMARGGVSVDSGSPINPQSFTASHWAKLIKEGAIVEVEEPKPKPAPKKRRTRKPKAATNTNA